MRGRLLFLLGLATSALGLAVARAGMDHEVIALHVLDVGQGDAILLRAGTTDILVDAGGGSLVSQRLAEVRPAWDRKIDVLVLTHPQEDHLGGVLPLLKRERVGLVVLPRVAAPSALFRTVVEEILRRGIPVRFARPGQRVSAGALNLTVLAPDERMLSRASRNVNNAAVVLRVDAGRAFSALLTGDVERAAEYRLVQRNNQRLDVDVLKVPHHGSKTSTSLRLLRATEPALALVSAGAGNRYGHPHPVVLRRLQDIPVIRTDQSGTISLYAFTPSAVEGRGERTWLSCRPSVLPPWRSAPCPANRLSLR